MPSFRTQRIVPHPPKAMFDLVADVERYPEFLPLCESLKVLSRGQLADGGEEIVAAMAVGYGPVRETFTTKVRLDRANERILVSYVNGPFRHLENTWTFKPHPKGCQVDFSIVYEFRSIGLGLIMGAMFDKAFRKFADAFETRADVVYGRPNPAINQA